MDSVVPEAVRYALHNNCFLTSSAKVVLCIAGVVTLTAMIDPLQLLTAYHHHLPSVARMPLPCFDAISLLPSHLTRALFTLKVSWIANTRQLGNTSLLHTPLQLLCHSVQGVFHSWPCLFTALAMFLLSSLGPKVMPQAWTLR